MDKDLFGFCREDGEEWKEGEHFEYSASIVQARNDDGSEVSSNSECEEEWLDLKYVSEGEPSSFMGGEEEKKKEKLRMPP